MDMLGVTIGDDQAAADGAQAHLMVDDAIVIEDDAIVVEDASATANK